VKEAISGVMLFRLPMLRQILSTCGRGVEDGKERCASPIYVNGFHSRLSS
jgi:hypothetical protein